MRYHDMFFPLFVYGVLLGVLRTAGLFRYLHESLPTGIFFGGMALALPYVLLPDTSRYFTWLTHFDLFGIIRLDPGYYGIVYVFVLYASVVPQSHNTIPGKDIVLSVCDPSPHYDELLLPPHKAVYYRERSYNSRQFKLHLGCTLLLAIVVATVAWLIETKYLGLIDRIVRCFVNKPPVKPLKRVDCRPSSPCTVLTHS